MAFRFAGKDLKKPPPKAILFEEKIERLLALPNREWDDINVPSRFKASSLWKNFVEIPTGIVKHLPNWVDWPFVVRAALRRLFGPPLFTKPLTDEETLVAESALDRMEVKLPTTKELIKKRRAAAKAAKEAERTSAAAKAVQGIVPEPFPLIESSPEPPEKPQEPQEPPAKKRKVVEKGKRKVPANRSKKSKVATPEPNDATEANAPGEELINFALPESVNFLQDRNASLDFMSRVLSATDEQQLRDGLIRDHFDDLMWESLKVYSQLHRKNNDYYFYFK